MHELTELIKKDMIPALGVTEPGAIAFCAAKANRILLYAHQAIHIKICADYIF